MGSKSSSSTSASTSYDTRTNNFNLQGIEDGLTVAGAGNTVTVTDGGAIKAIENVANKSVERASDISIKSLDLSRFAVGESLAHAERASRSAMQYVFDASQPETAQQKDLTKSAMIAAAIIGGTVLAARAIK